jgi:hypothetical protein
MNQKTIKMLNAFATKTEQSKKEVRNWWKSLNWLERSKERKRIQNELTEE